MHFWTLTWLAGKSKFARGNKYLPTLAFSFAIIAAFVQLVPSDQVVQLRIVLLVWNVTSDPLFNPGKDFAGIIPTNHWCITYPQQHVIVRCSTCLILFFPVKVVYGAQHFTFDNNCVEEGMELR